MNTPLLDSSGEIIGVLAMIRDITEQKKTADQLHQAQKMESIGRLAGGVAHDFNNMLSVIIGNAELGLMCTDNTDPLHECLVEIKNAADRSSDLTRQLLAFARQQAIQPKVINLNDTVSSMLRMLQRLIGEDITLTWQAASDLWRIKMDPSQVDQILANLCVNARDAIQNTGKIMIETHNRSVDVFYCEDHFDAVPGDYVRLSVSDDGIGMDRDTRTHIFEPFYTTKEMGKGTGLGLATVYGIVKQNNGFINVYSEPGKGTTFSIYLPRFEAAAMLSTENNQVSAIPKGHESILLVEDESAILKMTAMMLDKHGYSVRTASTPGEAIALAAGHSGTIHLLMTDVIMPEMNGWELTQRLMVNHPDMKILFMSGYAADVIGHHGVLNNDVNFIQKPFSMRDMLVKVHGILNDTDG